MRSALSRESTEMNTPLSPSRLPTIMPAEVSPLKSASPRFFPMPSTSPVDFISGPRLEFTSVSFSNENTGTLTAVYGGTRYRPVPYGISARRSPSMTREATSTIGTPVTLDIYGTVRDALGLTSMTYSSPRQIRY